MTFVTFPGGYLSDLYPGSYAVVGQDNELARSQFHFDEVMTPTFIFQYMDLSLSPVTVAEGRPFRVQMSVDTNIFLIIIGQRIVIYHQYLLVI